MVVVNRPATRELQATTAWGPFPQAGRKSISAVSERPAWVTRDVEKRHVKRDAGGVDAGIKGLQIPFQAQPQRTGRGVATLARAWKTSGIHLLAKVATSNRCYRKTALTILDVSPASPVIVANATSAASRPVAMRTRPSTAASLVGSKKYH